MSVWAGVTVGSTVAMPVLFVLLVPFAIAARHDAEGQEQARDDNRYEFCFHFSNNHTTPTMNPSMKKPIQRAGTFHRQLGQ